MSYWRLARSSSSSLSSYLPPPTTLRQTLTLLRYKNDNGLPPPETFFLRIRSTLSDVMHAIEGVTFHPGCKGKDSRDPAVHELWKFDVKVIENTWSRSARRKRKRKHSISPSNNPIDKTPQVDRTRSSPHTPNAPNLNLRGEDSYFPACYLPNRPTLQCWISALDLPPSKSSSHTEDNAHTAQSVVVTLEAQWTRGKQRGLFEGFWSHVCRKVTDKLRERSVPVTAEGGGSTSNI